MRDKAATPDYTLDDERELTTPDQVKAISDPLRTTILGLLHERAASVTELAKAVGRPTSSVAHHVNLLTEAGLLQVVRTRRVRAVEERFYGRTARMFYVSLGRRADGVRMPPDFNDFEVAAEESGAAYGARQLRSLIRHARIPEERAAQFWDRVAQVVHEFDELPRSGDTTYGFVVGLYPVPGYPTLPTRPAEDG